MPDNHKEGLRFARFLMVLSSFSPLFLLWAIQGCALIPEPYFIIFCVSIFAVPNLFLALRIWTVKKLEEKKEITIDRFEDHRDHLLLYLFTMLLPFYAITAGTWRGFTATIVAILFIIFLFWYLNFHYMNIIFALFGYRIFTIYPNEDGNDISGKEPFVLITKRKVLPRENVSPNDIKIVVYRLSDTVFMELDKDEFKH